MLLQLDVSAMMGYTGAIFKDFFGTSLGIVIAFFILLSVDYHSRFGFLY
jgi:Cu-processing system permease protein